MKRAWMIVVVCAACGSNNQSPFMPQPVNPDAVRKACAMEVSCFASPPITPGGSCISQFEMGLATGIGIVFGPSASDLARYVNCANAASNCTDALDCASHNHGPDWCNAHPNPTCDGDTLVSCIGGWGLSLQDCTSIGMHCGTSNGVSSCTDGNSCDPSMPPHCQGNRFVECNGGLESSYDCGSYFAGGTCVSMSMGTSTTIGCMPPASGSCGGSSQTVSCDGTAAVACADGIQLRVECGQFASHCVVTNGDQLDCVPDASDCTSTMPDSCSGDSLQMCQNGKLVQTACSSIGLSSCHSDMTGTKCQ